MAITQQQYDQLSGLACVVWAMLDAEQRNAAPRAQQAVPVLLTSYNAWVGVVHQGVIDMGGDQASVVPALSLPWSGDWDWVLGAVLAIWCFEHGSRVAGWSGDQINAMIDVATSAPQGAPALPARGAWFANLKTQLAGLPGGVPDQLAQAAADFARDGASALSADVQAVALHTTVPQVPSQVPPIPPQTTVPGAAQAAAFVMPHAQAAQTGPEIDITGRAPAQTESFPLGVAIALGVLAAIGIGAAAYAVSERG